MSKRIESNQPSSLVNGKDCENKKNIFVGNLTKEIDQLQLKKMFLEFGQVFELFIYPNLGFASVQMDCQASAEEAVEHLDGVELHGKKIRVKLPAEARSVKINTYSSTSIKVEDLSPMVTNERLKTAFSQFGKVEKCVVVVDDKGQSMKRGIVEFSNKASAQDAVKQIEENCFLITSSPQPVSATLIEQEDSNCGLPEEKVTKSTEYYQETLAKPRFALPGSFEDQFARTWKLRYQQETAQRKQFEANMMTSRATFRSEMEKCLQKRKETTPAAVWIKQEIPGPDDEENIFKAERTKESEASKRVRTEAPTEDDIETPAKKVPVKQEADEGFPRILHVCTVKVAHPPKTKVKEEASELATNETAAAGTGLKRSKRLNDGKAAKKRRDGNNGETSSNIQEANRSVAIYRNGSGTAGNTEPDLVGAEDAMTVGSDESNYGDVEETSCRLCAKHYQNGAEAMKKYFSGDGGEERSKRFLLNHGLLPRQIRCIKCDRLCCYEKNTKRFRCNKTDQSGERCRYGVGDTKGTMFSRIRINYSQFMTFLFNFLYSNFAQAKLEKELHWSGKTVASWMMQLSRICQHYVENQTPIGGPGTTVQIDEIFVCKRKDGDVKREFWMLSAEEKDPASNRKILHYYGNRPRSSKDIIGIIQKCVIPGGSVVTDKHAAYKKLGELGYELRMHGIGTQTANYLWGDLQYHVNKRGQKTAHMASYIYRYIFIKSFESEESRLHQFLETAASLYPLPT